MNQSLRHRARVLVLQSLFSLESHEKNPDEVYDYIVNEFGDEVFDDTFAKNLYKCVLSKKTVLKDMIRKAAPEWPIEKIAIIDLSILMIGLYELLFDESIPDLVAVNEAVEISKEFGGYNSSKFINGVLSTVMNNKSDYL